MRRRPGFTALVAAVMATGCASAACAPAIVAVERKEARTRVRTETGGVRADATGQGIEDRRDVLVSEYRVLGRDGRWYDVSEAEWQAAERGRALSLCR